ncbi:unnamed protein product [Pylaiella littoralis]
MWSSKEVALISIATGFVFCFATICAQNKMKDYINQQVKAKTQNPLIGMGLARRQQEPEMVAADTGSESAAFRSAPPGSGTRWTPISDYGRTRLFV